MSDDSFSFWSGLDDAFFHKKEPIELTWVFCGGKNRKKTWRAALLCLLWTLWKERNKMTSNDVEQSEQAIKSNFIHTFVNWARVYTEDHTMSMVDFVDWLILK